MVLMAGSISPPLIACDHNDGGVHNGPGANSTSGATPALRGAQSVVSQLNLPSDMGI
jgi:hypothetical protein